MTLGLNPKFLLGLGAALAVLIVVLLQPGGTAETAGARLAAAAGKTGAPAAASAAAPASAQPRASAPRWFAPEPDAFPPQAQVRPAPISVPANDPQPVYLDPPPSGPDFPKPAQ